MFELTDKMAVITGAGSGIGQALALLFAKQGAHVVILDIDRDAAAATVKSIQQSGGRAASLLCDVSKSREVRKAFQTIDSEFRRIDILVNNAGIAHVGTLANTSEEDFDQIYNVNVKGVFLCSQAAISAMLRQNRGVILNMASIVSLIGIRERFAYTMTKGAVLTMTRAIAVDYMKNNIRCNCICPARVHTPFVDGYVAKNYPGGEPEMLKALSDYQPIGRMGRPEEVAALGLYLCSDESAFVTGQAYPIDGGVLVT
jgi:NAD(P)-dependent dehydrogenase (short-subunit alcohol dehydrogenase family)